jgi:spoIIIJ-associated protein
VTEPGGEAPREIPMNDDKRRFFSGDSLQQAVVQAANYFNLEPEWVAYRSLEKRHGFLKTRRKVVIEVDPENPRREAPVRIEAATRQAPPPPPSGYLLREPAAVAEPPSTPSAPPAAAAAQRPEGDRPPRESRDRGPRGGGPGGDRGRGPRRDDRGSRDDRGPRREGERSGPAVEVFRMEKDPGEGLVTLPEKPRGISDRYPAATGPVAEAAARGAELLVRIAGLDLKAQVFQGEEGRLEIDLAGDDTDWCFQDDGELLQAIEHLLPRMIRSLSGEAPMPVRVDCDNFHEIREERLRSLAQQVAEDVRKQARPRILEPMNPSDRRIIHTTLADDPFVVTESEGDGYFKRIMVRPA